MIINLIVGCALLQASPPVRCRCIQDPQTLTFTSMAKVRPLVDSSHRVFVGRAIAVRVVNDTFGFVAIPTGTGFMQGDPILADFLEYTVVVSAWWGDKPQDTVAVRTPAQSTMCGITVELNREYIFPASIRSNRGMLIDKCQPPRPAEAAQGMMDLLDQVVPRVRRRG